MIYSFSKRLFDLLFAVIGIIVTLPLQVIIYFALLIHFRENPFFVQLRGITFEHSCFYMLKFRTIKTVEAEQIETNNWEDIFLTQKKSIVITRFAKWLRLTGLDELPQLYNILIGDMSFVGPRPLMKRDLMIMKSKYAIQYKIRSEINSKPGITGTWQVFGNRNLGCENLIALDLFYENNKSFIMDIKLVWMTIPLILFAKNSDAILPRIEFVSNLFSYSLQKFKISKKSSSSKKQTQSYNLELPSSWWYSSDSYSQKKQNLKIFPIEKQKEKKAAKRN